MPIVHRTFLGRSKIFENRGSSNILTTHIRTILLFFLVMIPVENLELLARQSTSDPLTVQQRKNVLDREKLDGKDKKNDDLREALQILKAKVVTAQLSSEQQKTINTILLIIESNLKQRNTILEQTKNNMLLASSAESRTEKQRIALRQSTEPKPVALPTGVELKNLQRKIAEQLKESQNQLKLVQHKISNRTELIKSYQQNINLLKNKKKELESKLEKPSPQLESALIVDARKLENRSSLQYVDAEIERINSESKLFLAEEQAGYFIAKKELWAAREKALENQADQIAAKIELQRRVDTQDSANKAKAAVDSVPQILQGFADENARIAELATSVLEPIKKTLAALKKEQLELDQLRNKFSTTENRVKVVGLTASVGAYLRKRKAEIPREGWLKSILINRLSEIEKFQSQQFDLREKEQSLLADEVVERILSGVGKIGNSQRQEISSKANSLINIRRNLLSQAIKNHEDYLEALKKLQNTESELSALTSKFHEYINERILWIRSNGPLFAEWKCDNSDSKLINPESWTTTLRLVATDVRKYAFAYLLGIVSWFLLLGFQFRFRQLISNYAELVQRSTNTAIWPTIAALFLTLAVSIPYPLPAAVIGWRVASIAEGTTFSIAIGQSLMITGWFFFLGEFFRQFCRNTGLASCHFSWPESTFKKLRRELSWFVPIGTLFVFFSSLLYLIDINHESDNIERSCSIITTSLFTIFLFRVLNPERGMFREQIANNPSYWLVQSRSIVFWLVIAIPLILNALIAIGFYYTALQMITRLFSTISVLIGLEIVRSIVMKFVQLSRRAARIKQSRARFAAQSAQTGSGDENNPAIEPVHTADIDTYFATEIATTDENFERSQKLITTGVLASFLLAILLIWADVFPAIRGLDRYVFWTVTIDQVVSDHTENKETIGLTSSPPMIMNVGKDKSNTNEDLARGPSKQETEDTAKVTRLVNGENRVRQVKQPVTLRNFLVSVFILVVSAFAVKNLPAFVELVFLKQLSLEQSLRHAIRVISGYIILMAGVVVAGRTMHIGWGQIQWLVTALTFGLAFGLQEIFANFIAGIILLLERPLRIGDIVQVGDISGVVTKIRIRATTIRNFDQKEFVIPNKEFITGRLLNWTLADKIIRQTLRVGIAYGSDVRKAKEIIKTICYAHPAVLDEPTPVITFEEFGDSSLIIAVRVYLKDFDSWFSTMDDINLAIDDAFKLEKIEISFPQRDLHLRSISTDFSQTLSQGQLSSSNPNQDRLQPGTEP